MQKTGPTRNVTEKTKASSNHRLFSSIKAKLLVLIVSVLVPVLLSGAYFLHSRYDYRKKEEFRDNIEIARAVGKTFSGFVHDVLSQEMAMGISLTMRYDLTVEQMNWILEKNRDEYPSITDFEWVHPQGRVIASSLSSLIGTDVSSMPDVKKIISAGKDWSVSDLRASKITDEFIFNINRAARDKAGRLLGIVRASVDSAGLDGLFAFERAKNAGITIVDSRGMLVYRHPALTVSWEDRNWLRIYPSIFRKALAGREFHATVLATFENKMRIVAVTPIDSIGWVAGSGRREEEVMGPITSEIMKSIGLVLLIVLPFVVFAFRLSRNISSSITALRNHALLFSQGKYDGRVEVTGPEELKDLARGLNVMAEEISSREAERSRHLLRIESELQSRKNTEALLRQALGKAEQGDWLLSALMDYVPEGIVIVDEAFNLLRISRYGQEIYGGVHEGESMADALAQWKAYDADGKTPMAFEELPLVRAVQCAESFKDMEIVHVRTSGERLSLLCIAAPICDTAGRVIGGIVTWRDITERRKMEEGLRQLSEFPEENPNPVLRCTLDGLLLYANPPAQQWLVTLGWQTNGPLPGPVAAVLNKAWRQKDCVEAEIISPAGRTFQVFAVQPSGETYINLYGIDITDRKRIEGDLRRSHDELDLRIQERTAELEAYMRKLKESNLALQDFASIASHDMQEPLRKVMSFGNMLEQNYREVLGDKGRDYLDRMLNATKRMQTLLKSLLDYSRVTTKGSPFSRVVLADIVRDVLSDLEITIENSGGEVLVGELPSVEADPSQMHQLFQNLIGNALKFRKEGEKPVVQVQCASTAGGIVEITVADNGIGFEEKYLDKIFTPFQRLHGRSEYEGTGMGLAICKKIVERHGGYLKAQSTVGEGSIFTVNLPLRQSRSK